MHCAGYGNAFDGPKYDLFDPEKERKLDDHIREDSSDEGQEPEKVVVANNESIDVAIEV